MPSSISNSKRLNSTRAIILLLTALVLYFCALEVAMRTVVPRISQSQHRQSEDYQAARALRPVTPEGSKTVLMIGNSLLLASVDRDKLREAMAPSYFVALFPIENTTYLDWYYGLRRFLAEGSRPTVIVLCLNARQLISNSINGEGFAHSMMQASDIVHVAKAAKLDMTIASNYYFANLSAWLGGRWFIRNWLLEKLMPNAKTLVGYLAPGNPSIPVPTEIVVERALPRLRELQELCKAHGARFVFLIPPSTNVADAAAAIPTAAAQAGIAVVSPFRPGEMPMIAFSDGFHLSTDGAALFTERLPRTLFEAFSE